MMRGASQKNAGTVATYILIVCIFQPFEKRADLVLELLMCFTSLYAVILNEVKGSKTWV